MARNQAMRMTGRKTCLQKDAGWCDHVSRAHDSRQCAAILPATAALPRGLVDPRSPLLAPFEGIATGLSREAHAFRD